MKLLAFVICHFAIITIEKKIAMLYHYTSAKECCMVMFCIYIGEIRKRKFGNYRAKSLYATLVIKYGDESYIVLPFGGNYDFCYSPEVHDMYHEVPRIKNAAFDVIYKEAKEGKALKIFFLLIYWNHCSRNTISVSIFLKWYRTKDTL